MFFFLLLRGPASGETHAMKRIALSTHGWTTTRPFRASAIGDCCGVVSAITLWPQSRRRQNRRRRRRLPSLAAACQRSPPLAVRKSVLTWCIYTPGRVEKWLREALSPVLPDEFRHYHAPPAASKPAAAAIAEVRLWVASRRAAERTGWYREGRPIIISAGPDHFIVQCRGFRQGAHVDGVGCTHAHSICSVAYSGVKWCWVIWRVFVVRSVFPEYFVMPSGISGDWLEMRFNFVFCDIRCCEEVRIMR